VWPWYSNIAPISWLVYRDVIEGRQRLNYSDWANCSGEACSPHEAREAVLEGEMPLPNYLSLHPQAQLTEAETQDLIAGLANSR
jgi:hypothetical protein